jgi:uncharacterized Zn finger protein
MAPATTDTNTTKKELCFCVVRADMLKGRDKVRAQLVVSSVEESLKRGLELEAEE